MEYSDTKPSRFPMSSGQGSLRAVVPMSYSRHTMWPDIELMFPEEVENNSLLANVEGTLHAPPVLSDRAPVNNCVACQDYITDTEIRAPCGHYYDKLCVLSFFEASTRDESLFPPRCCQKAIPLGLVRPYMTDAFAILFAGKSTEFQTPISKRVYCANPSCSSFLGAQVGATCVMTCPEPRCGCKTCITCKALVYHRDDRKHACKALQDEADEIMLALVSRQGWARCPGCGAPVERTQGCDHMTCRCKTQFCYKCKEKWKNCKCLQGRTAQRAQDRVVRRRRQHVTRAASPAMVPILSPVAPPAVAPVASRPLIPTSVMPAAMRVTHPVSLRVDSVQGKRCRLDDDTGEQPFAETRLGDTTSSQTFPSSAGRPNEDERFPKKARHAETLSQASQYPSSSSTTAMQDQSRPHYTHMTLVPLYAMPLQLAPLESRPSVPTSPAQGSYPSYELLGALTTGSIRQTYAPLARVRECQNHRWHYVQSARGHCRYCAQSPLGSFFQCPACGTLVCQWCTRLTL
ncbi:hypothetical protein NEOLEDRAFT_812829 [Neolentinus lepideus HHB14362 ss-1]|uniref:RBR-type E3 ubiquitin transferase n=1 Tax=Neolentinus lepideus HHB14362 ss-1 TaxID=1314782 RepID=A0A165PF30_9AGAM|nr:hypothetical protein NEOLEDRAFT_812829 [Neolentinus lepideus HHB14362 ss-1]